jgi:hypothetical protein
MGSCFTTAGKDPACVQQTTQCDQGAQQCAASNPKAVATIKCEIQCMSQCQGAACSSCIDQCGQQCDSACGQVLDKCNQQQPKCEPY